MFTILRDFRRLVEAIEELGSGVRELVLVNREAGPATTRLEALELSRHQFEAECSGALLEAKGKQKGALSSEARERHMRKQSDKDLSQLVDDGEEVTEARSTVQPDDAAASDAHTLLPLRVDVAANPKAAAINAKWMR